ncbi:putative transcription factor VOZ1/VOZ2 [Helianthus debilis subsp. tardiflorus]
MSWSVELVSSSRLSMDLQSARKESRNTDMVVLEEQVHQMLKEWKKEHNQPSPASSLHQGGSLGSFSPDISRLLQLCDEDDDGVTSGLAAPKPDLDAHNISPNSIVNNANFVVTPVSQEHEFKLLDQYKDSHLWITTV